MVTLSPVVSHDDGELYFKVDDGKGNADEIKDNEEALNFRTWYVELMESDISGIGFEVFVLSGRKKKVQVRDVFSTDEKISVKAFTEREIERIQIARDGDVEAICEDAETLYAFLKEKGLEKEDLIYIMER